VAYFLNIGSTSVLGEYYEQNGVDKKRGRVRLNRLGGRKMGELYGGREAEIGKSLKSTRVQKSRDRESAEGSENDIRIVAPRILGCLTVRVSWNSIFIHQSRIVMSSTLALSFYIAWVFLLVSAAQLQGAQSKIEKHMRGQRMRQKKENREGWVSSVKTLGMGHGVMYATQVVKIECLKVKF